jgi:hypothetical protein
MCVPDVADRPGVETLSMRGMEICEGEIARTFIVVAEASLDMTPAVAHIECTPAVHMTEQAEEAHMLEIDIPDILVDSPDRH